MLSLYVRLLCMFAAHQIRYNEKEIDVYNKDGSLAVAIREGVDRSEELGASHRLTLDPIPKDCRLYREDHGRPEKVPAYAERLQAGKEFRDAEGVALSIGALKKKGYLFDESGECIKRPAPPAPKAPAAAKVAKAKAGAASKSA